MLGLEMIALQISKGLPSPMMNIIGEGRPFLVAPSGCPLEERQR